MASSIERTFANAKLKRKRTESDSEVGTPGCESVSGDNQAMFTEADDLPLEVSINVLIIVTAIIIITTPLKGANLRAGLQCARLKVTYKMFVAIRR